MIQANHVAAITQNYFTYKPASGKEGENII